MKRIVILFFIVCGLAGCKSQTPSVDPFFGRTTIPPPPTGSVSGQARDPYYQSTPPGPTNPGYNPSANPTSSPSYAGSGWTNPSNRPSYSGTTASPFSNPSATAANPTNPSNPLQPVPQNYPGLSTPPANVPQQAPYTAPGTVPATPAGQSWPGGNRYTPPGGSFNYRGAGVQTPNPPGTSPSSNRFPTPFFAGGTPNRTSIPAADNSPRPLDDSGEKPSGLSQGGSSPAVTYNPGSTTSGSNISLTGRSPITRTLEPLPQGQSYSQGNNYSFPAGRRSSEPTPAQQPGDSTKPAWRESTSFESTVRDDNIEMVSDTEPKGE